MSLRPSHRGGEPDEHGRLDPDIETSYYADDTGVPFSRASREEIVAAYTSYGPEWQGCFTDIDSLIRVTGMSALYGAVTLDEARRNRDDADGDAYVLAASAAAVLLHLAVQRAIVSRGLPRPLAILVGSNEDFPFIDAPVAASEDTVPYVKVSTPAEVSVPVENPQIRLNGAMRHSEQSPQEPSRGFFRRLFGR